MGAPAQVSGSSLGMEALLLRAHVVRFPHLCRCWSLWGHTVCRLCRCTHMCTHMHMKAACLWSHAHTEQMRIPPRHLCALNTCAPMHTGVSDLL